MQKEDFFSTSRMFIQRGSPSWINTTSAEKIKFCNELLTTFFTIPKNAFWMRFYVQHPCVKSIHRSNKKSSEKYYFSILVLKSWTFQHPFQCWKVELFSINIERHWFSILLFLVGKSRPFHSSRMTEKVSSFTTELQKKYFFEKFSKFCIRMTF